MCFLILQIDEFDTIGIWLLGWASYLNKKIWFGLVLQQVISADHLHPWVSKMDLWPISLWLPKAFLKVFSKFNFCFPRTYKGGCEEGWSKPLGGRKLFIVFLGKMKPCSRKNKFKKTWTLRKFVKLNYLYSPQLLSPVENQRCCLRCCAKNDCNIRSCSSGDAQEAVCLLCPRQCISLHIWTQPKTILGGRIWKNHLVSQKICLMYNPWELPINCLRFQGTNQFIVHVHQLNVAGKLLCCILVKPHQHLERF